jgi:methylated-DNA-[protein]-cysteine S-methyltransferase
MSEERPLVGSEFATPFGPVAVLVSPEDGVLRASSLSSLSHLVGTLPPTLARRGVDPGENPRIARAIAAWVAGDGSALAAVPAWQDGGSFMQRVWEAMRKIPSGQVMTYGELAAAAGNPRAARAAGHACATNTLAPFVPCHRVVASTGLGSYGFGGAEIKARMLRLEGARIGRTAN